MHHPAAALSLCSARGSADGSLQCSDRQKAHENPDISQRTGDEAKGGEWEFGIWGTWEVRKIVLKSLKNAALWSRLVSVDDPGEQVKRKREEGNIMVYM